MVTEQQWNEAEAELDTLLKERDLLRIKIVMAQTKVRKMKQLGVVQVWNATKPATITSTLPDNYEELMLAKAKAQQAAGVYDSKPELLLDQMPAFLRERIIDEENGKA